LRTNNTATVLVVGGSTDNILVVKKLKSIGFRVVLVDRDPGCDARDYCDFFEAISTFDYESQIAILEKYKIFYCVTRSTGIAARNCYRLNEVLLFGATSVLADSLLDKAKLATFCDDHEILYPRTQIAIKDCGLETSVSPPYVIKPIYEKIGKKTTFKVVSGEDADCLIEESNVNSHVNRSIIQEYIDGVDYSLIGYVNKREYLNFGLFYENNAIIDGKLDHRGFHLEGSLSLAPFMKIASEIAKAVDIPLCPLNIGFRVCKGSVFLLECNLDFGGEGVIEDLLNDCELDLVGRFVSDLKRRESFSVESP
jgi:hypothetical protein